MYWILAVLSTAAGAIASLLMAGLLLAGSPNSSPAQWSFIKWSMLWIGVVGLIGLAGAIWAMVESRPGLAAIIGAVPTAFTITLFTVLIVLEK
jgi:hypothetical protein